MIRARIGDLIAIPTKSGVGYAQYTHRHTRPPKYGTLLRVFPGVYPLGHNDIATILAGPSAFYTFTVVNTGMSSCGWLIAGHGVVREEWARLPPFRTKAGSPALRVPGWKIWDDGVFRLPDIPDEQLKALPVLGTCTPGMVAARIQEGWRPERVEL